MTTAAYNKKKALTVEDRYDTAEPTSFEVTVSKVIGTVEVDPYGQGMPAHEAAFLIIARYDERGQFQFPMRDGRTMTVSVDYPDEPNGFDNPL